jgi:hypothetical protein
MRRIEVETAPQHPHCKALWDRWRDRLAIYGLAVPIVAAVGFGGFGQCAGGTMNRPPTMIMGVWSKSARHSSLSPAACKISVGNPVMMAAVPCFNWSSALNNSARGATVFGREPSKPLGSNIMTLKLWTAGSRANIPPFMPADIKAFRNSKDWIKSHCLWLSIRGLNWASNWVRAKSAFDARSFASAARALASATIPSPASLARLSNSNSPQTPARISAFATIVSAPSSNAFFRIKTATISAANPTSIKSASRSAHAEFRSYRDRNSLSLVPLLIGLVIARSAATRIARLISDCPNN